MPPPVTVLILRRSGTEYAPEAYYSSVMKDICFAIPVMKSWSTSLSHTSEACHATQRIHASAPAPSPEATTEHLTWSKTDSRPCIDQACTILIPGPTPQIRQPMPNTTGQPTKRSTHGVNHTLPILHAMCISSTLITTSSPRLHTGAT